MNSRFTVLTRPLESLPVPQGLCSGCDRLEALNDEGFCGSCAASLAECAVCGREYAVSGEYEDEHICRECNPYYEKYIGISKNFFDAWNDILSLYSSKKKSGELEKMTANEICKEIVKIIYMARNNILGGRENERTDKKHL